MMSFVALHPPILLWRVVLNLNMVRRTGFGSLPLVRRLLVAVANANHVGTSILWAALGDRER